MFVREKRIGPYTYVYLVETVREDGKTKQRIIRNLGRKEDVERRGDLDRLARSVARLAQRSMVLSLLEEGSVRPVALQAHRAAAAVRAAVARDPVPAKCWTSCSPRAASSFRSSAPSSSPCSTG